MKTVNREMQLEEPKEGPRHGDLKAKGGICRDDSGLIVLSLCL